MTKNKKNLDEFALILRNSIPSELQTIFEILWTNQKEVYVVGGAVRDCLLEIPVQDFDITTNAHPKQIEKLLNEGGIKTRPIGSKYGTILAVMGKKAVFEVSTFRREIYSAPNPPEVIFIDSLEEDLARRDFRFNAIAFDPKNKKFIDKYDGFNDIQKGRIRTIGDPYVRLSEDGTRIIRLARFVSLFNLNIHPDLSAAVLSIGKNARFHSYPILQKEFFKFLMLTDLTKGLYLLWNANTLAAIFPNFPFLKSRAASINLKEMTERINAIPSRDIWIRLFGFLMFLSDESAHTKDVWYQVGQDLKIKVREQKKLNHIYESWINFPQLFEVRKLKRWVRATGINTSEDLLQLIFLQAELVDNSELLLKKELFLEEIQTIINSFREKFKLKSN